MNLLNSKPKSSIFGPTTTNTNNFSATVASNNSSYLPLLPINQQQMDDLQIVLKGCWSSPLDNPSVPNPKLRQIRIYLCSTFTGTNKRTFIDLKMTMMSSDFKFRFQRRTERFLDRYSTRIATTLHPIWC